jgi:hypothetical protein
MQYSSSMATKVGNSGGRFSVGIEFDGRVFIDLYSKLCLVL